MRRALLMLAALLLVPLAAAEAGVQLVEGAFEPAEVHVGTWEWVAWWWPAGETHAIAPVEGADAWCEPGLPPCRKFFEEPGEYRYHDPGRPELGGLVVVETQAGDANAPLRPFFLHFANGLSVTFDATPTAESSTAIASYTWDFGDGASGEGPRVSHAYAEAGRYRVTLVVVDETGRQDEYARDVRVERPVDEAIRFNATGNGRGVQFDAAPSNASHAWDFGDGERAVCDPSCVAPPDTIASSPTSVLHVYRRGGVFNVTHQAWDANGTRSLTVPVQVDAEETFSLSAHGLTMEVDASFLPRYGNASFAWLFGDLASASGERADHTFPTAGVWSVTLRLADEAGVQQLDREAALEPLSDASLPPTSAPPLVTPSFSLLAATLALAVASLGSERYK